MVRTCAGDVGSLSRAFSSHARHWTVRRVIVTKSGQTAGFDVAGASKLNRSAAVLVSFLLFLFGSPFLRAQTVTVSPGSLSLGSQAISTTSNSKNVTLKNGQTATLTITSIATSGDYSQTNTCGTSLAAGAKCTISVAFTPSILGTDTGTLTITDTAGNSPQTVPLTGKGVAQATVAPATLSFGNEAVGTSSTVKNTTLTNNLPTALSISSIGVAGDYAQTNTCGSSLAAGASCAVSVTFTPTTLGSRTGTLTISDSASNSPQIVSLTGNGVVPVTVSPMTLGFGNQVETTTSAAKTVTVTNKQPTGVSISSVTAPADYVQTNTCGTSLAAGATCTVSVAFTPTTIGSLPGTLTITDNASNSPQTVNLTGTGTALPSITSLSVTSGIVGASVTIKGTGFGSPQGSSTVTFNGVSATATTWKSTSIVASVPSAATTGAVVVTVEGGASNGVTFTVLPTIAGLSALSGVGGASVTIGGSGFGALQGTSTVTFNGTVAAPTSWSSNSIAVPVPTAATAGNGTVVVSVGGVPSNGASFEVVPSISLSSTSGAVGTSVTITGTGFGSSQGSSTVTFNGTPGTPTSWGANSITVQVPTGATTGNVVVTVGGVPSNPASFTVTANSNFAPTTGAMESGRNGQTATQLPNGKVLITGGLSPTGVLNSAELYDPATQNFTPTGSMNVQRWLHTATLLNTGQVLITGGLSSSTQTALNSAELYDPASGTFTLLGITLNFARGAHTATLVSTGQVLIVGGYDPANGILSYAELYDPRGVFYNLGYTNTPRMRHTATALQNGLVLIAGGETDLIPSGAYNTAETYNPATFQFTALPAAMTSIREGHSATLLNNGQVLLAGGDLPGTGSLSSAEIYDPTADTFTPVSASMTTPRVSQVATLLNNGKVLIAGGSTDSAGSSVTLNSAETYDPAAQTFTSAGTMSSARERQTSTLLNNGVVMVDGGTDGNNIFNTADLYSANQLTGLTSITVTPSTPSIAYGTQQLFTAIGTFIDGSTETIPSAQWNSSSTSVLALSNDATDSGFATSGVAGTAIVTASAAGISGSTSATVLSPPLAYVYVYPSATAVAVGTTQQFSLYGVYADGSTQNLTAGAAWISSDSTMASVNSAGVVAGVSQGQVTIQATYGLFSATAQVYVTPPYLSQIAVTPASSTIPLGSTEQFQAIGTYTDGSAQDITNIAQWSAGANGVARESVTGLATGTTQGTTTIVASYGAIYGYAALTVGAPSLQSLTVTPGVAGVDVGSSQQFKATGNYSDGSVQDLTSLSTWSSSNSGVATINASGLANALVIGASMITATYGSISGTATLNATSAMGLNTSRYAHTATLLDTGKILLAGGLTCAVSGTCSYLSSAELFDSSAATFDNTGSMAAARSATAVLLENGKVLVAGGYACNSQGSCASLNTAEIYDPVAGTFSLAGNMTSARTGQTMTLLSNGTVLIAGGQTCNSATSCYTLTSAETYDPNTGLFLATSNTMNAPRYNASAVALNGGLVLIAGGFDGTNLPAPAELYDPTQGSFAVSVPSLNTARFSATATLLNSGQVLFAGGSTCNLPGCPTAAAEIYDPVANTFNYVSGGMNTPRFSHTATLLTNGQVLVTGGYSSCGASCMAEGSTELFDPTAGVFTYGNALLTARAGHSGTLLSSGKVALIGGLSGGTTLASAELYQPASLSPATLVSISVAPSSASFIVGQTRQFVASGTFSDGSTQIIQSVIWNSSSPSAVSISNAVGSAGFANALSIGTSTISATAGNVTGSATISVPGLVSITVTPANPAIALNATQELQLTANGLYSDGSSQNISNYVTWNSSNSSVATVLPNPAIYGVVAPVAAGTSTFTATLGNINSSTVVTVTSSVVPVPPAITGATPTTGNAGTPVTINGSGFGATQGTGSVWLGTTLGSVVSWSDTQVVANVNTGSSSGVAQIQQGGTLSNSVPFTVVNATIIGISPTGGLPGTPVTITGSGFGVAQGNGTVWLGTAPAIVTSWSDGLVVATVASGSASGTAQILQNGVWSNSVSFTIDNLQVSSASPNSGPAGTVVTITGGGFGTTQGSGNVWIGTTNGVVVSWSDNQILASVASSASSGTVKVQQNNVWSNAVAFAVPPSLGSQPTLILVPSVISMVAGDTRSIEALNASGQSVTGLAWTSSDTTIATLSTDDPPIITAVAPGNVTISVGNASADLTVYAGPTLPTGTTVWSNLGDGTGVTKIVPAVPSASGAADVFALQASGLVQALRSDGTVAWQSNASANSTLIPDFQGGVIVTNPDTSTWYKLDGLTGQAYPSSPYGGEALLVHPTGIVFDGLAAIDPITGQQKFTFAPKEHSVSSSNGNCGEYTPSQGSYPATVGQAVIAGDGYLYFPFLYSNSPLASNEKYCYDVTPPWTPGATTETITSHTDVHLRLMRVGTDGSTQEIPVGDWAQDSTNSCINDPGGSGGGGGAECAFGSWFPSYSGAIPGGQLLGSLITNADQGALYSWSTSFCNQSGNCNYQNQLSTVASGGGASTIATGIGAQYQQPIQPMLQRQDGTYVGTVSGNMVAFSSSGQQIWNQPNYAPQITNPDGSVIAQSPSGQSIMFDQYGNAAGMTTGLTQSWRANTYQFGSVDSIAAPINLANASDFWALLGANSSHNGTGFSECCMLSLAGVFGVATSSTTPPSKPDVSKTYTSNNIQCNKTPTQVISDMEGNFSNFGNYTGPFGMGGVASAVVTFSGSVSLGATITINNVNVFPVPSLQPPYIQIATKTFNVAVQVSQVTATSFTFATLPGHVLYPATISFSASLPGTGQVSFAINVNGNFANLGSEIGYYGGGSDLENHIWNHVLQQVQADCKQ